MARKPKSNVIHLQPTWEFFKYCSVCAEAKIASGEEPDWFRAHFDRGQHIEQEYGLPPWWPLLVALALDFSYEMTADSLKDFREMFTRERSRAKKFRAHLRELRDFSDFPLMPLNDLIDKMVQAIDTFLEQPVKFERKTSSVKHAVRLIDEYVEEKNPSLNQEQRNALCHYLFDVIRRRHRDYRRWPDHKGDKTPRYRDLFERLAKRPA